MFKQILTTAGATLLTSGMAAPLVINIASDSQSNSKKVLFNGQTFASYEEAAESYLNFIGSNISSAQYYGDDQQALINKEMNIIDIDQMRPYNPHIAKPAYLTASGNNTHSLDIARKSYANMGNARTWYSDGVTDIPRYTYEDALAYGRSSIVTPVYATMTLPMPKSDADPNPSTIQYNANSKEDMEYIKSKLFENDDVMMNMIRNNLDKNNTDINNNGWTVDFAMDTEGMYGYDNGDFLEINGLPVDNQLFSESKGQIIDFYTRNDFFNDSNKLININQNPDANDPNSISINSVTKDDNDNFNIVGYFDHILDNEKHIGPTYTDRTNRDSYENHSYSANFKSSLIYNGSKNEIEDYSFTKIGDHKDPVYKRIRDKSYFFPSTNYNNFWFKLDGDTVDLEFDVSRNNHNFKNTKYPLNLLKSMNTDNFMFELNLKSMSDVNKEISIKDTILDIVFDKKIREIDNNQLVNQFHYNFYNTKYKLYHQYWTEHHWWDLTIYNHKMELHEINNTEFKTSIPFDELIDMNDVEINEKSKIKTYELFNNYPNQVNYIIKYNNKPVFKTDKNFENIQNISNLYEAKDNVYSSKSKYLDNIKNQSDGNKILDLISSINDVRTLLETDAITNDLRKAILAMGTLLKDNINFNQLSVDSLKNNNINEYQISEVYAQYLNSISQFWNIFFNNQNEETLVSDMNIKQLRDIKHIFVSYDDVLSLDNVSIEWKQYLSYDRTRFNRPLANEESNITPINNGSLINIKDPNLNAFLEKEMNFYLPKPSLFWVVYSVDGVALVSASAALDNSKYDVIELILDNLNRLNPVKFASNMIYLEKDNGTLELFNGKINKIYELNHRGNNVYFNTYDGIKKYIIEYIKENSVWK